MLSESLAQHFTERRKYSAPSTLMNGQLTLSGRSSRRGSSACSGIPGGNVGRLCRLFNQKGLSSVPGALQGPCQVFRTPRLREPTAPWGVSSLRGQRWSQVGLQICPASESKFLTPALSCPPLELLAPGGRGGGDACAELRGTLRRGPPELIGEFTARTLWVTLAVMSRRVLGQKERVCLAPAPAGIVLFWTPGLSFTLGATDSFSCARGLSPRAARCVLLVGNLCDWGRGC